MAWQNGPKLTKLTSAQHAGKRGAHLWGVDVKGTLYSIYQQRAGADWSQWKGPDWAGPGYPKQVYELAACQGKDGRVTLFTLDMRRRLQYVTQDDPDGDWTGWRTLDWDGSNGILTKLTAVQRGKAEPGAELWAVTTAGEVLSSHQWLKEARWFEGWYLWPTPPDAEIRELAAARQHDGHVALWGLDQKLQLWSQTENEFDSHTPPTGWGTWQGPNWGGAPKLRNIAAVRGAEGVILWGIDENFRMIQNWQNGQGKWNGWSHLNWLGAPHSYELTAAGQNNQCVQLWAVSVMGTLTSIAQNPPGCAWGQWSDKDNQPR